MLRIILSWLGLVFLIVLGIYHPNHEAMSHFYTTPTPTSLNWQDLSLIQADNVENLQLITSLEHDSSLTVASWSSGGNYLAVGSAKGEIWLYDTNDFETPLYSWQGQDGNIVDLTFSPDGNLLASSGLHSVIRIWDTNYFSEQFIIENEVGYTGAGMATSLKFIDNETLIFIDSGGLIQIWDIKNGKQTDSFQLPPTVEPWDFWAMGSAFSNHSQLVAVSPEIGSDIELWNWSEQVKFMNLIGHGEYPSWSLQFNSDDTILVSGSDDNSIRLWDISSGQQILLLEGHEDYVRWICFSPDSKLIASSSWDKTTRIWDLSTGKQIKKFDELEGIVSFNPAGNLLAISNGSTLSLWGVRSE
jgi:WD40 repeat protein